MASADEILADAASDYSDATDSPPPIRAHGHIYHHSGKIWTPCDEAERGRQEQHDRVYKLSLNGGLASVPLPTNRPIHVLDVGTGNGRWAVDMGAAYPLAQVTGVDVSAALLPTEMPRNVNFEIEDVEESDDSDRVAAFDFVHIRSLEPAGIMDWPSFLARVFNWLKPGGWIEIGSIAFTWVGAPAPFAGLVPPREADGEASKGAQTAETGLDRYGDEDFVDDAAAAAAAAAEAAASHPETDSQPGAGLASISTAWVEAAGFHNVHPAAIQAMPGWLSEAGFEKVVARNDVIPLAGVKSNDEAMKIKCKALHDIASIENYSLYMMRFMASAGFEEEEVRGMIERMIGDLLHPEMRATAAIKFLTARRPL